ncbi:hypothetical protein BDP27DRAFT_951320 [Rhodocollybia butyracea]|uniref:Mid2 domain-containing protein n=1 Tax=Rhodocollybia butyracea TaxID=206335 RepID=A0A9P5UE01_9AGAR|nr:hypothetical protein BDP27DRAFT_951320 [Rhodocollybia butyracea]
MRLLILQLSLIAQFSTPFRERLLSLPPDEGICFGATTGTATGTPYSEVLEVISTTTTPAASTLGISTAAPTTPFIIPTTTTVSNGVQNSRKSSVGTIVGSTIAGLVVISTVVFFVLWRRRRKSHPQELVVEQFNIHAQDTVPRHQTAAGIQTHSGRSTQASTSKTTSNPMNSNRSNPSQPRSKRALANPSTQGNQQIAHPSDPPPIYTKSR